MEHPPAVTRPPSEPRPDRLRAARNTRQLAVLSAIGLLMFGFAYANAPLFFMLCKRLGVLPADVSAGTIAADTPDARRPLTVYFLANPGDVPIAFSVRQRVQDTFVGARAMNEYTFTNLSKETVYFRPVHDIEPREAGFEGTMTLEKCFCFEEQRIEPRQTYVLPVIYRFGESLDPATDTVTMSYTLFPSTKERYDLARRESRDAAAKAAAAREPAP